MKRTAIFVLLIVIAGVTAFVMLPSSSRDRRREAIDSSGYFSAYYGLNRAMEEYAMRHYGQVPRSIEQLAAAEMVELGSEEEHTAQQIAAILSRTVIKPFFADKDTGTYIWVAAVMVPKWTVDWREYIYFRCELAEAGRGVTSGYRSPEDFAREFGQDLLGEVRNQSETPAPLGVKAKPRLPTLVGHVGSWPDTRKEPRWYVTLGAEAAATTAFSPIATTQPVEVWESRRISTFLRPLTFAEGAWRVKSRTDGILDSQAGRLALRVRSCGGGGDDTVRLSLRSLRQGIITLPIDVHTGNAAEVLFLSLQDATGRTATWIYDLPGSSQATLRPRGGATLERPNGSPEDGQPLDLGRINKWELKGDPASEALLSVSIRGIVIEGPRVAN